MLKRGHAQATEREFAREGRDVSLVEFDLTIAHAEDARVQADAAAAAAAEVF